MEEVGLRQVFGNGTTVKRNCLVFSGTEGAEGLLYVKDRFDLACEPLEFDTGPELFDGFQQVLSETALDRWMNHTTAIPENQRTIARFNAEYARLLRKYTTELGRDHMIEYLNSGEVLKPHDEDCQTHAERMAVLVRRTNQIEGSVRELDANDEKKVIFHSFPKKWQMAYTLTGRNYLTDTTEQIVDYMATQKIRFDQMEADRRRTGRGNRGQIQRNQRPMRRYQPYSNNNYYRGGYNNNNHGNPGRGYYTGGRGYGGRGFGRSNYGGRGSYQGGRDSGSGRGSYYSGRAPQNNNASGQNNYGNSNQNFYVQRRGRGGRDPSRAQVPNQCETHYQENWNKENKAGSWPEDEYHDGGYDNNNFQNFSHDSHHAEYYEQGDGDYGYYGEQENHYQDRYDDDGYGEGWY